MPKKDLMNVTYASSLFACISPGEIQEMIEDAHTLETLFHGNVEEFLVGSSVDERLDVLDEAFDHLVEMGEKWLKILQKLSKVPKRSQPLT